MASSPGDREVIAHPVQPAGGSGGAAIGGVAGTGIGLRTVHIHEVLSTQPSAPWFELLGDNHFAAGGLVPRQVEAVREQYPLTLHFVGMNVAGTDPLDPQYLKRVRRLADISRPAWISDHLCFTACHGRHYHDLLPIPYTEEALRHVTARVQHIQDYLAKPLILENVSAYLRYRESALTEAQFLAELVQTTGCGVLLDVNNLYVNHINHGDDLSAYLDALPMDAVREIHLAGHEDKGEFLLDAHNNPIAEPVWELYEHVARRIPDAPALIEWDRDIPAFEALRKEAARADAIRARAQRVAREKEAA